jgi:hypothetical protein
MILAFLGGWILRGIGIGIGSLCMGMDGGRICVLMMMDFGWILDG